MVLSTKDSQVENLRSLKTGGNGGNIVKYRFPLSDLQAALGINQLQQHGSFLEKRLEVAETYFRSLDGLKCQLPNHVKDRSNFFRFPIRSKHQFEELRAAFDLEGIQVRRGVDALLHRTFGFDSAAFPVAERLFEETVSIPIYPALGEKGQQRVIGACRVAF